MTTHTAPPRDADRITPDGATKTVPKACRYDERGIALQTVIIMVVMLAIAGAVATVMLTRGGEATSQLEAASVSSVRANNIKAETLCNNSRGLVWGIGSSTCKYDGELGCKNNGGVKGDGSGSPKRDATKCYASNTNGAQELGDIKS